MGDPRGVLLTCAPLPKMRNPGTIARVLGCKCLEIAAGKGTVAVWFNIHKLLRLEKCLYLRSQLYSSSVSFADQEIRVREGCL